MPLPEEEDKVRPWPQAYRMQVQQITDLIILIWHMLEVPW